MSLITVVIVLIIVGVVLWLINAYIPMASVIKTILNVVVVIVVILWLLSAFGVYDSVNLHLWAGWTKLWLKRRLHKKNLGYRGFCLYPEPGSNRHEHHCSLDFKSNASTYSATRAKGVWVWVCKWSVGVNSEFKIKNLKLKSPASIGTFYRSGKRDSNPRPRPWQGRALPAELLPQYVKKGVQI